MDKCIFCTPHRHELFKEILVENDHAIVVADNFPVSPGHSLVIPKQHFEHWFNSPSEIQHSITDLLQQAYEFLSRQYKPDGFNVGANCGVAAGQTVLHLHYHIIPRFNGDHGKPAGGIRHILNTDYPY